MRTGERWGDCKEPVIFTTPNKSSVSSLQATFTSVVSARKCCTALLFESDTEQFHTERTLRIVYPEF